MLYPPNYYLLTTNEDYIMSCIIADQEYYKNNSNPSTFSFERYEMGTFAHHAMRAYNANESYMIDISLGGETGSAGTQTSGSGGRAIRTTNVNLRMIQRTEEQMVDAYGVAKATYPETAKLTQRLLLLLSACVFAKYLKDANGNYNRFLNNCQHFCNDLVKVLEAGEVSMPDGYEMDVTPEKVVTEKYTNFNYAIIATT